jgi:predicted transcriptional regulator
MSASTDINWSSDTITINVDDYLTTVSGSSGDYLISNGVNGFDWGTLSISNSLKGDSLEVVGDANFQGDLKLQGKSLKDSLDRIEERLAILRPNEELEEKWENLRGLRKAYMELEAEIIEKEKMWAILQK